MPQRVIDRTTEALRLDAAGQRVIAGRLVMSALASQDRADSANLALDRMEYLRTLEHRLLGSLEQSRTRETIAHVALPGLNSWAVVDVLEADGTTTRLAMVHPDFARAELVNALNACWLPGDGDSIGYAAAKSAGRTFSILDEVDAVLTRGSSSPDVLALFRQLAVGACLVVPLCTDDVIDGAITFMSAMPRPAYTNEEVAFAEQIAAACSRALRNSRNYRDARRLRETAEATNRVQAKMLGEVTHELRTPLNAIGGYADLMQMGIRGPVTEEQQQDLKRIKWNQEYLLSLVTQILNYVHVEADGARFTVADIELGAAVREVVEMLAPLVVAKRQPFRLEGCDSGVLMAQVDIDKVRQIVINLLTNAVKYSEPDSEVVVRCGTTGLGVFVEVEDRGVGIEADQLESIFEPFVQLASGADTRAGGVGLGLAISRRLARGMQGMLTVRSEFGHGSVFRLTLPRIGLPPASTNAES